MKKVLSSFLCVVVVFCFVACNGEKTTSTDNTTVESHQRVTDTSSNSEITTVETTENTTPTERTTEEETTKISEDIEEPTEQAESVQQIENTQKSRVFQTENIARITFYAYGGNGKGSEVPEENMTEIINWLGSFTIDKEVVGEILPGTNTRQVEIEYTDGTVIKQGLDVVVIDGIRYDMKSDKKPDCFEEIMSKTSYK